MSVPVPPVEITDHRDVAGVRSPDGEVRSTFRQELRSKVVVDVCLGPFVEEMYVEIAEKFHGGEPTDSEATVGCENPTTD